MTTQEYSKEPRFGGSRKGCWYLITIYECPVCGRAVWYRERRDPPKPDDPRDRHVVVYGYDFCQE